jgi:RNA polymerase sigma factor (sigma-70 family)
MNATDDGIEQTVERCERLIRSFLLRHRGVPAGTEIEDCLQEARIRLWKVLDSGRDIEFLAAYIRKIVDSIVVNQLQKSIREREFLSSPDSRALAESPAREDVRRRRLIEEVQTALDSLMASRRTVLEMSMAGQSLREIAEERKWSRKKTYTLYERGIRDLRRVFKDRGWRS